MDEFEIDSTAIFKQNANQLTTTKSFDDALNKFGYSADDKISRRDLVLIFNQVRNEMEQEIFRLASTAKYQDAKDMRNTLDTLRREFDKRQISGEESQRILEVEKFGKGSKKLLVNLKNHHDERTNKVYQYCDDQKSIHQYYQEIEREKLEKSIAIIPQPNVKVSKRLIELQKAELSLNKLCEYEEAIKVRKMIDKLLPNEEKKFLEHFEKSIESKREKLIEKQNDDAFRLEEKLTSIHWKDVRKKELETSMYVSNFMTISLYKL
jgi:23S rRNA A1618 N6-methylase RlmF